MIEKKWDFWQYIETLRKQQNRNMIILGEKHKIILTKRERLYQISQNNWKPTDCVYFSKKGYKLSDCKT